jgi:hypothetical protein
LYTPLLSPIRTTCPANLILLDLITQIFGEEYRSLSSQYAVFSTPLLPLPSSAQISFSAPILMHPQPTFLPQCQRPSFALMHNRKNYSSVYLNFWGPRWHSG